MDLPKMKSRRLNMILKMPSNTKLKFIAKNFDLFALKVSLLVEIRFF